MLHGEFFSNTKLGGKSIFTSNDNMMGFPCGSAGKESTCNVGDLGLIPGLGRSPEKGKATHSSILAWRIPWIKSMGSQRVRQDWANFTHLKIENYIDFE